MPSPEELAKAHLNRIRSRGKATSHTTFQNAVERAKREGRTADLVDVLNEEQQTRDRIFDLAERAGSVIPSVLPGEKQ